MINFRIEFDKSEHSELMEKLEKLASPAEINKRINSAAKRTADAARTETVRQLSAEYTLPVSELRGTIFTGYLGKFGSDEVGAVMKIKDSPRPLYEFNTTPRKTMPPAKGPVRTQVKKGGEGSELSHAFVAKMPNGHVGVYERRGKKSLPIDQLFGPSTPSMFDANAEVNEAVMKMAAETFEKRIMHELGRLIDGD